MTYEKELAFHLRARGLPEERVAEVLADVHAHPDQSDRALAQEFGSPDGYAEQFPAATKRVVTRGGTIAAIGTVVAVGYALAAFVALPLLGVDVRDTVGPVRLWPALVVIALALIMGFLVDRGRPLPGAPQDR